MKQTSKYALALAAAGLFTAAGAAQAGDINFKTDGGLKWETEDGKASGQFGGRVMVDGNYFDDDVKAHEGGFEFRRLRLFGKGVYMDYEAKVQIDFAGGDVDLKDAYIAKKAFGGTIKGGHFKHPFGLEELTSSKYITFAERGFGSEGIATSRKMGLGYQTYNENNGIGFAASVYSPEDLSSGDAKSDGAGLGGRLTWAPHADAGNVTHFGIAAASESNTDFAAELRPEAHLGSKYTMIDVAGADVTKLGLEAAMVRGPFSLQGEYMTATADPRAGGTEETLNTYYAQISYFLTGDARVYKAKSAAFDRVKPAGNGAWELALRMDGVENDDTGAEGDALTF
ncbi:MAG: OprO/OprP family phosphate-selective porin, partial [Nevskiales bacterium]